MSCIVWIFRILLFLGNKTLREIHESLSRAFCNVLSFSFCHFSGEQNRGEIAFPGYEVAILSPSRISRFTFYSNNTRLFLPRVNDQDCISQLSGGYLHFPRVAVYASNIFFFFDVYSSSTSFSCAYSISSWFLPITIESYPVIVLLNTCRFLLKLQEIDVVVIVK